MAYHGAGYVPSGSVFGGFAGGYTQTPEGYIIPPNTNVLGIGNPAVPGLNLPSVDPNNFPGTVHFGPSTAVIGPQPVQFPVNTPFIDPNLGVSGIPGYGPVL